MGNSRPVVWIGADEFHHSGVDCGCAADAEVVAGRRGRAPGREEGRIRHRWGRTESRGRRLIPHEGINLKFQTDFFNAFNVANFTGLDTNVSDRAFGTLSSAYPPRNLQMQLKVTF